MRIAVARVALLPVAALVLTACGSINATNAVTLQAVSKHDLERGSSYLVQAKARPRLPQMMGQGLDGETIDVGAMRGHVVVVNVWASWCAPCIAEAPNLAAVWKDTSPLGVRFVGIDIKDDRSAAKSFQRVHHVPYPSIFDQPGLLLLALRGLAPQVPPTTLLIDRSGRIAARFPGGVTKEMLLGPVRSLAAEGN
jgi:thiol-disulfide isomerase/thioredoxin